MMSCVLCALMAPLPAFARQLDAKLIKTQGICKQITDGWTLEMEVRGRKLSVTFIGIISPKKSIPKFQSRYLDQISQRYLNEMFCGEVLTLEVSKERDENGVHPAYVRLPNGINLNSEIIRKGYAKCNEKDEYRMKSKLLESQSYAREKSIGIWDLGKSG